MISPPYERGVGGALGAAAPLVLACSATGATNGSFHRHALRWLARLVDIAPAQTGDVIRQELKR